MKIFFLFFVHVLFLWFPASSWAVETFRASDSAETVSFVLKEDDDDVEVAWRYPAALSNRVDSLPSDEERFAFFRAELKKQAEEGDDTWDDCLLGYLFLYGIGVEQDIAEAKRRFGIDFAEFERSMSDFGIQDTLSFGNEPDCFFDHAAELVMSALPFGKEDTADKAIHIVYFASATDDPQNLEMSQRLMDAVAEYFPDREYALYESADIRFKRELYGEAWSRASAVLDLPDVSQRTKTRIDWLRKKIAYHFISEDEPDYEKAQSMFDAILESSPDDDYSLYFSAKIRWQRGLYDEAWSRASAVLDLPDISQETVDRIDLLRNKIAYHFISGDEPDYEKAQSMSDAIVESSPENDYALYLSARMRWQQGLYAEAWDKATALLELPDIDSDYELGARGIRLQTARKLGYEDRLVSADFFVPIKALFNKLFPGRSKTVVLILFLGILTLPMGLLTWLTRRKKDQGPGWVLTGIWGFVSILASSAIILKSYRFEIGILGGMLLCFLLALNSTTRKLYFPRLPVVPVLKSLKGLCVVLLWYGLFCLLMFLYGWLYSIVIGHELEPQMVALFLQGDSVIEKTCVWICTALIIPITEEIVFRGFLIDCLRRKLSWTWSIILSALLFGILHGIAFFIPIAILGGITGYFRFRYNHIWASVFLHCLNNGLAVFMLWLGLY